MSAPVIGFAGMTHLGLVSATAVASRGFQTICYDADDCIGSTAEVAPFARKRA